MSQQPGIPSPANQSRSGPMSNTISEPAPNNPCAQTWRLIRNINLAKRFRGIDTHHRFHYWGTWSVLVNPRYEGEAEPCLSGWDEGMGFMATWRYLRFPAIIMLDKLEKKAVCS